jgi:acetylornithine deacetylase/succinyl-diaminopimelate desuccinylase-like protein
MKLPVVSLPLSSHDSNDHAPNENIRLRDFFEGIRIAATIIEHMGGL